MMDKRMIYSDSVKVNENAQIGDAVQRSFSKLRSNISHHQ